jgi:hypothetical protein
MTATVLVLLVGAATASAATHSRVKPFRWYRSAVVGHGHVVRIAMMTGADEQVLRRVKVREGKHTVRIRLFVRVTHEDGYSTPAIGYLRCVQVRLRHAVGDRKVVDAITGRSPDRARPGTRDAAQRDDTWSVDLHAGPCQRLRPHYLPGRT